MGGSGSGFQDARKAAVEDGLTLSISALMGKGALVPGRITAGTWAWHYGDGDAFAKIGYVADMRTPDAAILRLSYSAQGHPVDDVIRLVWTSPRYGGRRWWFLCPVDIRQQRPPRRAAKLYLPPGARHFGSRQAHGLTYQSCRESRHFSGLWRRIGERMGVDPSLARRAFKRSCR
jgi:hypothetical protein